MTDDHECRKCYKKALKLIQDYLVNQCKEGESLLVEVYGSYGRDCYISVDYDVVINKKHVSESEHLPAFFMERPFIIGCIPQILDSLLKQWRGDR